MNRLLVLLGLCAPLFLTECKKGTDDPFLSLRSRRARVEGSWTMKSGKLNSSYTNSSGGVTTAGSQTYTFNHTTYSSSTTNNGFTTTTSGSCSMTMKFEKDGKMEMVRVLDGKTMTSTGTWNFTGKIGELKNKEQIVIHFTSQKDQDLSANFQGNFTDMTFNIRELRNKKMVITSNYTDAYSDGYTGMGTEEYTLEQ
ncbi:MAG TPA: hypothetical protein VGF30_12595 [Bacteroidia bacterium]